MDILLNDHKIDFGINDFPILISGAEKIGASLFTVCMLANLLKSGNKVILFSAHPEAKEEFKSQVGKNNKAIIIESEDENIFIETIKNIPNLSEIVVLIKNIDSYSSNLFKAIKDLKLIILSGDLDKCRFANNLLEKHFTSKIFFSYSEKYPLEELKDLPRYCGKIISYKYNGMIRLAV